MRTRSFPASGGDGTDDLRRATAVLLLLLLLSLTVAPHPLLCLVYDVAMPQNRTSAKHLPCYNAYSTGP